MSELRVICSISVYKYLMPCPFSPLFCTCNVAVFYYTNVLNVGLIKACSSILVSSGAPSQKSSINYFHCCYDKITPFTIANSTWQVATAKSKYHYIQEGLTNGAIALRSISVDHIRTL